MVNIINYQENVYRNEEFFDKLCVFIDGILTSYNKKNYEVNIVFCGNDYIKDMNCKYRNKDYATDVLSFSSDEDCDEDAIYCGEDTIPLGDVVISYEKAVEQAKENDVSIDEEILRLCIHGVLHLLGYDHEQSETEEKRMFDMEDSLMQIFMKE